MYICVVALRNNTPTLINPNPFNQIKALKHTAVLGIVRYCKTHVLPLNMQ